MTQPCDSHSMPQPIVSGSCNTLTPAAPKRGCGSADLVAAPEDGTRAGDADPLAPEGLGVGCRGELICAERLAEFCCLLEAMRAAIELAAGGPPSVAPRCSFGMTGLRAEALCARTSAGGSRVSLCPLGSPPRGDASGWPSPAGTFEREATSKARGEDRLGACAVACSAEERLATEGMWGGALPARGLPAALCGCPAPPRRKAIVSLPLRGVEMRVLSFAPSCRQSSLIARVSLLQPAAPERRLNSLSALRSSLPDGETYRC